MVDILPGNAADLTFVKPPSGQVAIYALYGHRTERWRAVLDEEVPNRLEVVLGERGIIYAGERHRR